MNFYQTIVFLCFINAILAANFSNSKIIRDDIPPVYSCDFDDGQFCGGMAQTLNGPLGSTPNGNALTMIMLSSLTVTDITSITRATSLTELSPVFDQDSCEIPWTDELANNFYFCRNDFRCKIPDQTLVYCQQGRFLSSQTNFNGEAYGGQFRIDSINLGLPGTYQISFYVLMSCYGFDDEENEIDSIYVIIDENKASESTFRIGCDNIGVSKRWQKKSFSFEAADSQIELIVQFDRTDDDDSFRSFFAFDEISIFDNTVSASTLIQSSSSSTSFVSPTIVTTSTETDTTTITDSIDTSFVTTTDATTIITTTDHTTTTTTETTTTTITTTITTTSILSSSTSFSPLTSTFTTATTTTTTTSSTSTSTTNIMISLSSTTDSTELNNLSSTDSSSTQQMTDMIETESPLSSTRLPVSTTISSDGGETLSSTTFRTSFISSTTFVVSLPLSSVGDIKTDNGLSTGAIVGIVIGSLAAFTCIGLVIFYLYNRSKKIGSLNIEMKTV